MKTLLTLLCILVLAQGCKTIKNSSEVTNSEQTETESFIEREIGMTTIHIPAATVEAPLYEIGKVNVGTTLVVHDPKTLREVRFWRNEHGQLMVQCAAKDSIIENLIREKTVISSRSVHTESRTEAQVVEKKRTFFERFGSAVNNILTVAIIFGIVAAVFFLYRTLKIIRPW